MVYYFIFQRAQRHFIGSEVGERACTFSNSEVYTNFWILLKKSLKLRERTEPPPYVFEIWYVLMFLNILITAGFVIIVSNNSLK